MELIKVVKEKTKVKVILKVGEAEMPEQDGLKPQVIQLNELVFDNKTQAVKYFTTVSEHNKAVIKDNQQRLNQIDVNALQGINEFVEVIKKSGVLGKRKSDKIEGLIMAHENMESFKYNIELTKKRNKINEDIVKELKRLK